MVVIKNCLPRNLNLYFDMLKFKSIYLVFIVNLAFGQPRSDPAAQRILDRMNKNYLAMSNFQATFEQKVFNVVKQKVIGQSEGEIAVSKNKYKAVLEEQEIYCNGVKIWTYNPEFNEVYISPYEDSDDNKLQDPSKIYTFYKKDFKYFKVGEQIINHQKHHIIDLIPLNLKVVNYFKVKVFINKKTNIIAGWQVFEKGNKIRYDYNIRNFSKNAKLPKDYFKFDMSKYPDVEVVE